MDRIVFSLERAVEETRYQNCRFDGSEEDHSLVVVNARAFCENMIQAATTRIARNRETDNYRRNFRLLWQYRVDGVPPYVNGPAVLA